MDKSNPDIYIYNLETSKSYTLEQMILSQGAAPPQDGKPLTWKQDTFEDPDILKITLSPLITLPAVEEHLNPSQLSNLKIALRDYCGNLMLEGNLTSCNLPNADPELPSPRYLDFSLKKHQFTHKHIVVYLKSDYFCRLQNRQIGYWV